VVLSQVKTFRCFLCVCHARWGHFMTGSWCRYSHLLYVLSHCDLSMCCRVLGMTLNCIHIFIVTGNVLYWCVMRPASQRLFIYSCIYLRFLIISYLATLLDTNSFSVLMCRKAVNQSINQCVVNVLITLWQDHGATTHVSCTYYLIVICQCVVNVFITCLFGLFFFVFSTHNNRMTLVSHEWFSGWFSSLWWP